MPTTSNFGWTTPADTDLVKDGAAAIRTLGNGIDTSLVDLKGGTTGQILSKASNTDLDYTWINNDQGDITGLTAGVGITITSATGPVPTITNSSTDLITTAGDILYGTAADTVARLGIGTAGQVLTVNSGATAPEWKVAPGAGWTQVATASFPAASSVTISGLTAANEFLVLLSGWSHTNTGGSNGVLAQFNTDTGSNYNRASAGVQTTSLVVTPNIANTETAYHAFLVTGANTTQLKYVIALGAAANGGIWNSANAISSITLLQSQTGNFDAGTYYVWSR